MAESLLFTSAPSSLLNAKEERNISLLPNGTYDIIGGSMTEFKNYAVAIILETPSGIPLVFDPHKPEPHFWKFPGGRNHPGETPGETAIRELKEETSVGIPPDALRLIHEEARGDPKGRHWFFLFWAKISNSVSISPHGAGGEMVKLFSLETIKTMPDFFPNHRALAERTIFRNSANEDVLAA